MFCMACGAQNSDTAQFCAKCGQPLASSAQAAPAVAPAPVMQQPQQAAQNYSQPVDAQYSQPNYGRPQQNYSQPMYATPAPAPEGCIGAAWNDIKSSPNWLKRVLILCLVSVVPIMNFAVDGYCLRWARELSFGKRASLPERIFRKREISTGFFAWVVSFALSMAYVLACTAAIALLAGIFSLMNVVAGIGVFIILLIAAIIVFLIFYLPAVQACVLRMTVTGYLEAGFNFKMVFATFRKSMGSLIGASLVPPIITAVISGIISAIISAIFTGIVNSATNSMYNSMTSYYYGSSYNPLTAFMYGASPQTLINYISGAAMLVLFMFLLVYVINAMLTMFGKLFSYRAVGHWVARTAPEWAAESEEGTIESLAAQEANAPAAEITAVETGVTDYSRPLQ